MFIEVLLVDVAEIVMTIFDVVPLLDDVGFDESISVVVLLVDDGLFILNTI